MRPYRPADADAELQEALARGDLDAAYRAAEAYDRLGADRGPGPSLGGVALWYAEHGLPVFPLQPGSKVPYPRSHGLKDATCDPAAVAAWWAKAPAANIALATGHAVDVIDVDGPDGNLALARLVMEPCACDYDRPCPHHDPLQRDYDPWWGIRGLLGVVSTPRPGGRHLYVLPGSRGNGAGVAPGLDYRGLGGYVVAPPSVLDDRPGQHAGRYRWVKALQVAVAAA